MSDGDPKNDKPCLVDHHARLAVLEQSIAREIATVNQVMDIRFAAAREAIQIKAVADKEALDLQYGITQKRLSDLNGEAERLRQMQASYVPREVFESKHDEQGRGLRALELWQSNILGRMAMVGIAGGLVSSIITTLVVKWISQ
jgi:hypothetical protein